MNKIHGRVYVIENAVNGKVYVGQSVQDLNSRWRQHCLLQGKCRAIENAIRKYGEEAFQIAEVAVARSQEELDGLERGWIDKLNCISPRGYNLSGGGEGGGRKHSQTKAILSGLAKSPERIASWNSMRVRPDVVAKHAASLRRRWLEPDFKARVLASLSAARSRPEVRLKHRRAIKEALARPGVREKRAAIMADINARPEVVEARRAAMKAMWEDSNVRSRRSAAIRDALNSPEGKARISAARTPEWRARVGVASTGRKHTEERRRAASERMTGKKRGRYKRHASDEQISRRGQAIKTAKNDPTWKAQFRKDNAKRWNDPIWREKTLAAQREARSRPDVKTRRSEIAKCLWQDPEFRARRAEGHGEKVRAGKARKKAEREAAQISLGIEH